MADYRIICTRQEPVYSPPTHAHIVSVSTGTSPDTYTKTWTLAEVVRAIEGGWARFHTIGRSSGRRAEVGVTRCPNCNHTHKIIRSEGDVVTDNNLDSLPECG